MILDVLHRRFEIFGRIISTAFISRIKCLSVVLLPNDLIRVDEAASSQIELPVKSSLVNDEVGFCKTSERNASQADGLMRLFSLRSIS